MSVEDEFSKLLAEQAAAADQLRSEAAEVAATLGTLRSQLIAQHFTTAGAEDLVLEWFVRLLDSPASGEDDD